ncbi:PQQ-binding-like beta-propeller repeat protein [Cellulomonas sp. IC4_254]|uniref:outer membrane protein assembly factor BamB family protein n=1 Tax=Cellulomonas sp. IC4_254 TaxID=2714040 RepID=UPI001421D704|nr:PQQ-binding-like beta-propeller repeat protein [Cellulomonas sp. IC4_254]NHT17857.1 PQQ-binding-like beta-propeller repeat protein [Cellulomonas sp. IC4_254]
MGQDRMADVQLVEDLAEPQDDPRPPSAVARRARALLRRWWPLPVAVVLALVAVPVVADHRAGARADRLRATPGVLSETVTAPLAATPWGGGDGDGDTMGVLSSGTRTSDGLVAGVLVPGPGTPAGVVALDAGTGAEVWRVEIGALPTEDGYTRTAACSSGGDEPADTLWCTVTDGPGGDRGPVTTRLFRVDLADRAATVLRELDPRAEAVVVGDVLVVAARQDGGVLLVGSGLAGGAERWRTELPDVVDEMYSSGWAHEQAGHVVVQGDEETWAVDPADGRVEAHEDALYAARRDALVGVPDSGPARLLGADGAGTATAEGYPLYLYPDDGSAPGMQPVLAQDGTRSVLRGVDTATGDIRWERASEPSPRSGYLLLEGVLYGSDTETVWAVDAATGEGLWSVAADPAEGSWVMTDGRHLLRSEQADDAAAPTLSAYDLGSGRRAWTTPLPGEVQALWPVDGVLYGYGGDGSQVFRVG